MRPKTRKLVITFPTTAAAMSMESACMAANLPGRLIPVPREITADCGMAWCAPPEARPDLAAFLERQQIPAAGYYELWLPIA